MSSDNASVKKPKDEIDKKSDEHDKGVSLENLNFSEKVSSKINEGTQGQFNQINSLVEQKKWKEAGLVIQQLIREQPENPQLYRLLATTFINTNEYNKALPYIEKAIKLDSKSGEFFFYRGVIKQNIERKSEALLDLLKAEELGYQHEYLQLYICLLNLHENAIEEAERRAGKLIKEKKSSENCIPELILGFVSLQKKDMNDAKKYYNICKESTSCPQDLLNQLEQLISRMPSP